jgi:hypothetical protein
MNPAKSILICSFFPQKLHRTSLYCIRRGSNNWPIFVPKVTTSRYEFTVNVVQNIRYVVSILDKSRAIWTWLYILGTPRYHSKYTLKGGFHSPVRIIRFLSCLSHSQLRLAKFTSKFTCSRNSYLWNNLNFAWSRGLWHWSYLLYSPNWIWNLI